jgi:putative transposase
MPRPYNLWGEIMPDPKPKYDPQKHQRKSTRLPGYDYAQAGAYFVTMVAYQRDLLFGYIENGEMILNEMGIITDECWREIPDHFPNVDLGAYVVMPNHVHGIVVITGDESRVGTRHDDEVDTTRRGTISVEATHVGARHASPQQKPCGVRPGSLGAIVGSFKSAVSKRIGREHNTTGIWQRNYFEHIIRDEKDLQRITDYIHANPLRWNDDDENPVNAKT